MATVEYIPDGHNEDASVAVRERAGRRQARPRAVAHLTGSERAANGKAAARGGAALPAWRMGAGRRPA